MKLDLDDRYLILVFITIIVVIVVLFASTFNSIHRIFYGKLRNFKCSEHVVLITGCDSGFGNMMALQFSKLGYFVVACCYSKASATALEDKVGLSLKVDVTNQTDIDAAYSKVEALLKTRPDLKFFALINNAGIAPAGCVDWLQLDAFRSAMEVNYFGLIMVTKSFLPLLKRTKGSRIINLSSVAGHMASFTFGAYSGSKHAVEGYAKSLRAELHPWDIFVCNVNPSFMKTPILQNNFELALKELKKAPPSIQDQYDPTQLKTLIDKVRFSKFMAY
jgi:NAD(P)-dependent dehydrogenase (short-subunit alcohol dehydrogenase family)